MIEIDEKYSMQTFDLIISSCSILFISIEIEILDDGMTSFIVSCGQNRLLHSVYLMFNSKKMKKERQHRHNTFVTIHTSSDNERRSKLVCFCILNRNQDFQPQRMSRLRKNPTAYD